ncbi:hypothetical protein [Roseateles flavus]|uniref:Uncharacterized protein n=1 Tax=Roseateles flavus TaxID=3149041 RepID=A0ABV0GL20_9BURK
MNTRTSPQQGTADEAATQPNMAEAAVPHAESTESPSPVFEPFSWIHPGAAPGGMDAGRSLEFVCSTRDVAAGVASILEMLEREDLDATFTDEGGRDLPRLFSNVVRGNLQRLAIASLQLLTASADDEIDRANRKARKPTDT